MRGTRLRKLTETELFGPSEEEEEEKEDEEEEEEEDDDDGETEADEEDDRHPALAPADPLAIDARQDQLLLRVVLARRPYVRYAPTRRKAWDDIARVVVDSGGASEIASGADVTRRLGQLTLALLEQPQRLPAALRAMVLVFNEDNVEVGYAASLGDTFLETLRKHATDGQVRVRNVPSTGAATYNARYRAFAVADTRLCQLLLHHRPFDAKSGSRTPAWHAVFNELHRGQCKGDDRGPLENPASAWHRVRDGVAAVVNNAHPYRAHMPDELRAMLVELSLLRVERLDSTAMLAIKSSPRDQLSVAEKQELFLRIVLDKRPMEATGGARSIVWGAVANAYSAVCGESTMNAFRASIYFGSLVGRVLRRHVSVTPALLAMVAEYYEIAAQTPGFQDRHQVLVRIRRLTQDIDVQSRSVAAEGEGITEASDSQSAGQHSDLDTAQHLLRQSAKRGGDGIDSHRLRQPEGRGRWLVNKSTQTTTPSEAEAGAAQARPKRKATTQVEMDSPDTHANALDLEISAVKRHRVAGTLHVDEDTASTLRSQHASPIELLSQLERVRLDHLAEHKALVELLKTEQDAYRQEAQAQRHAHLRQLQLQREVRQRELNVMLEALDRERVELHEELLALANRSS